MKKKNTRREFIKQSTLLGAAMPLGTNILSKELVFSEQGSQPPVYLFSKHLQFLDYPEMAKAAKDIGFDGIELTVREGGHVDPEKVTDQLPRAIDSIKKVGLKSDLMVSDITELNDRSRTVLRTAAELGIKKYRMGYYDYPDDISMPVAITNFNQDGRELSALNQELGIQGMHQNHAGGLVGASIWEIWMLLKNIDSKFMGCQYDIRHAMVDGGMSWPNGLRLIQDRISTLAIKDFRWEKMDGEWDVLNTPLGEGMVDFVDFFKKLKQYGIKVPVTLHLEYDLYGAEHGDRDVPENNWPAIYSAMTKDLQYIKKCWREA